MKINNIHIRMSDEEKLKLNQVVEKLKIQDNSKFMIMCIKYVHNQLFGVSEDEKKVHKAMDELIIETN